MSKSSNRILFSQYYCLLKQSELLAEMTDSEYRTRKTRDDPRVSRMLFGNNRDKKFLSNREFWQNYLKQVITPGITSKGTVVCHVMLQ